MRLFLILILRSSASRVFYTFLISFSTYLAAFSQVSFSRAAARLLAFLILFSIISRAFFLVQSLAAIFYLPSLMEELHTGRIDGGGSLYIGQVT
jgi:hypothetical protein